MVFPFVDVEEVEPVDPDTVGAEVAVLDFQGLRFDRGEEDFELSGTAPFVGTGGSGLSIQTALGVGGSAGGSDVVVFGPLCLTVSDFGTDGFSGVFGGSDRLLSDTVATGLFASIGEASVFRDASFES